MPKNLTIDARLINCSGIGVYLQNVFKSNRLKKYNLKVLYKGAEIEFFKNIRSDATMVEYNAGLYSINELLQTPLKTIGSDIFWSPHFNVPIVNFAKKKIATIHDVFHLAHYDTLTTKQKAFAKIFYSKAVNDSDIIFTVSQKSKSEIVKYTNADAGKIKVVYNGIEYQKFNTAQSKNITDNVLKDYGIHFPYVLFVGNIKPHKNLEHGLLGFKEYLISNNSINQGLKFVIVGRKEGFITGDHKIDSLITDPVLRDKVHFTGWVIHEHLPMLYQQARVFIFPSIYEGFGFPPLEAMAAGCPVISSNASCMPEVYGDAALYFSPTSNKEIGAAFHSVLNNEVIRNKLITKGFLQAQQYNWEDAINQKFDWIEA